MYFDHKSYLHVWIVNPASGEKIDEVGILPTAKAKSFCKRFNKRALKDSSDWRLAIAEKIPHSAEVAY